jgi:hypothetical protein
MPRTTRDGLPAAPTAPLADYGTEPLPPAEATQQSFSAFPSWFLRIECDRCGTATLHKESHAPWRDRLLSDVLKQMRHGSCGACPERRSC